MCQRPLVFLLSISTLRIFSHLSTRFQFYDSSVGFGLREWCELCTLDVKLVSCLDASISISMAITGRLQVRVIFCCSFAPSFGLNPVEGCCGGVSFNEKCNPLNPSRFWVMRCSIGVRAAFSDSEVMCQVAEPLQNCFI
jgi:hypothetical protein